jgi:hypothetical protein
MKLLRRLPEYGLGTLALVLLLWIVGAVGSRVTAGTHERFCRENLKAIHHAIQRYREANGGDYPSLLVAKDFALPGRSPRTLPSALVPEYLADPKRVLCPAARPGTAEMGWTLPCSYSYELIELSLPQPEARRRITRMVHDYGNRLRLIVCMSRHPTHPRGRERLTLRADGVIDWERILADDPQTAVRRSCLELPLPATSPVRSVWPPVGRREKDAR